MVGFRSLPWRRCPRRRALHGRVALVATVALPSTFLHFLPVTCLTVILIDIPVRSAGGGLHGHSARWRGSVATIPHDGEGAVATIPHNGEGSVATIPHDDEAPCFRSQQVAPLQHCSSNHSMPPKSPNAIANRKSKNRKSHQTPCGSA